jgi:hypothetical protein
MRRWFWSALIVASIPAVASAQELSRADLPRTFLESEAGTPSAEPVLPTSLADPEEPRFSIGPAGGYLRAHGADQGTWFGGVQARLKVLPFLAIEGSITFHENEYEDGDIKVTQYPVQVTALLYILHEGSIRPYVLGGVGWYYTRVDYSGLFGAFSDSTDHDFGGHLGAGVDLMLGARTSLDVDVRYIFLNPSSEQIKDQDFNYWQITFGVNFYF